MTTKEAYDIIAHLQELEFPYVFSKARMISLLKAGGILTTSKVFAVTGQKNRRNGGKRAVDTEILLREYESAVAKAMPTKDQYVRVYVDSATSAMPEVITNVLQKMVGFDLDESMRASLCLEAPEPILKLVLTAVRCFRKLASRHLSLSRPSFLAVKAVDNDPNPLTGLDNFNHHNLRLWYVKPTFWKTWGPLALLMRVVGGRTLRTHGDKYYPQGYDLKTIGSKPQEGKGFDEMRTTVEFLKSRGSTGGVPFPYGRKG